MNTTELKKLAEAATPGPWEAVKKNDANPSEGSFFLISKNSGAIGYQRGHKSYHTDHQLVLHENDAAYIAAANPSAISKLLQINAELVEALKNMLGEFNEQTINEMVHNEFMACVKARAALAKAEGGEL